MDARESSPTSAFASSDRHGVLVSRPSARPCTAVAEVTNPQELKSQFELTYQVDCLERAARDDNLGGRRVLEIGGSLPERLVLDHYGAAAWTSVDHRSAYSSAMGGEARVPPRATVLESDSLPARDGHYVAYDGDAKSLPPSFDGAFDVVFSIAAFEHIADLASALQRMYAALRPGGVLLPHVGPVWSGFRGHHIFSGHLKHLGPGNAEKTDDLLDRLVPWQHLIMGPTETQAWLTARYGADYAAAAVDWIYESPRINRLSFDDYRRLFAETGFLGIDRLRPSGAPVPAGWLETLAPLLAIRHPGRTSFEIDCFWATLKRPG